MSSTPSTLHELLDARGSHADAQTAVRLPPSVGAQLANIDISYAKLRSLVRGVVQPYLHASPLSITPRSAVAIHCINNLHFVLSFLSVTGMGAIAAPLNPVYTHAELQFYLRDSRARAIIVHDYQLDKQQPQQPISVYHQHILKLAQELNIYVINMDIQRSSASDVAVHMQLVYQPPSAPNTNTPVSFHVRPQASSSSAVAVIPSSSPSRASSSSSIYRPQLSDVALLLHTSGTTSQPKAVPLSHGNLTTSMRNIIYTYALTSADISYCVMPLFHVHGLIGVLLSTFASGGAIVLPPRFSAAVFWQELDAYQCTWYSAVPTIHQILLQHEATAPFKPPPLLSGSPHRSAPLNAALPLRGQLRFIRSCSSALAAATHRQLEQTFGVCVLEAYAMTEAAHQMTSNPLPERGARIAGSVGQAQGEVKVAVLSDADGDGEAADRVLPAMVEGEICVRGANVTPGYLNNADANRACFTTGGWFRTGDRGYMDKQGYVFITGRLKELINRGGEKISPLELDSVLLSHARVAEAITFAVPDSKYGQEVHAAVVLKAASGGAAEAAGNVALSKEAAAAIERELIAHVARCVAAFKTPKRIYIANTLPKTSTGKIQRRHVATHFLQQQAATNTTPATAATLTHKAKL